MPGDAVLSRARFVAGIEIIHESGENRRVPPLAKINGNQEEGFRFVVKPSSQNQPSKETLPHATCRTFVAVLGDVLAAVCPNHVHRPKQLCLFCRLGSSSPVCLSVHLSRHSAARCTT